MSVNIVTLITAVITARTTAGAVSIPGLKVGDRVIAMHQTIGVAYNAPGSGFEPIISVDDEIQQTGAGDGITIWALTLVR
jgi:hypothetical protein